MLRIAVPNKGSLADASIAILREAGYKQRNDSRDLILVDNENDVEFYYLRPRDIAIYVGSGELEAGITGRQRDFGDLSVRGPFGHRRRSTNWIRAKRH